MKLILSPAQMYRCDSAAMEHTPSRTLMERAAHACADAMTAMLARMDTARPHRVFVLCGSGNNGGDGVAAARLLRDAGISADLCLLTAGHDGADIDESRLSEECRYQYHAAKAAEVPFVPLSALETEPYTAAMDALFGIGLARPIGGVYLRAVQMLKASRLPVIAVDIPSGIDAATGAVLGDAAPAAETVTMAYLKQGLMCFPGAALCGRITTADIGISADVLQNEPVLQMPEPSDLAALLPPRPMNANKGTFGRILIAAGSKNMSGAAYFSAKAAYRTGAGLVRFLTPEDNRVILQTQLPEAIMTTYDGANPDPAVFSEAIRWADAIVIGPGLGRSDASCLLTETVLREARVPVIADADALNLIAEHAMPLPDTVPLILTPHPGEFSRLTGQPLDALLADLPGAAAAYAKEHRVILCAKDAHTVITDGETVYLNTSGSSALAKGGSGDVLTGIIAGMLAAGLSPLDAAAAGCCLHGLAGRAAAETYGEHGVLASDTADCAALALRRILHPAPAQRS